MATSLVHLTLETVAFSGKLWENCSWLLPCAKLDLRANRGVDDNSEGTRVTESPTPNRHNQVPESGLDVSEQAPSPSSRTTVHNRDSALGWILFRTPTAGPELDLVNEYLSEHLPTPPRGQMLTVFLEPEIESGFPDLVAVYWSERVASAWDMRRAQLTVNDIRVAHFLATAGRGDAETLKHFFSSRVSATLDRLHAAKMIRRIRGGWLTLSLSSIFAVRRLIAIEAKVTNPREGLQQAILNTWFASESYLLLPKLPLTNTSRRRR